MLLAECNRLGLYQVSIQELGIDPMYVVTGYWQEVATGDAYMAMESMLSHKIVFSVGDLTSALLNAIRSIESLYAAQKPGVAVEGVSVQAKIDDAVSCAGDVGTQVLDAWPELRKIGVLRREVVSSRVVVELPHPTFR